MAVDELLRPVDSAPAKRPRRVRPSAGRVFRQFVLVCAAILALYPVWFMVSTAFKSNDQYLENTYGFPWPLAILALVVLVVVAVSDRDKPKAPPATYGAPSAQQSYTSSPGYPGAPQTQQGWVEPTTTWQAGRTTCDGSSRPCRSPGSGKRACWRPC